MERELGKRRMEDLSRVSGSKVCRVLLRIAGIGLVIVGAVKLADGQAQARELMHVREDMRYPITIVAGCLELLTGACLLSRLRPSIRGTLLAVWAAAVLGGRTALETGRTCHCLGLSLPAPVTLALLVALAVLGLGVLFLSRAPRIGRSLALVTIGVALVLGRAGIVGFRAQLDYTLAGEVSRTAGIYQIELVPKRGAHGASIAAASSSCDCVAVEGVDGLRLALRVVYTIPYDVTPYLSLSLGSGETQNVLELEVPLVDDAP